MKAKDIPRVYIVSAQYIHKIDPEENSKPITNPYIAINEIKGSSMSSENPIITRKNAMIALITSIKVFLPKPKIWLIIKILKRRNIATTAETKFTKLVI